MGFKRNFFQSKNQNAQPPLMGNTEEQRYTYVNGLGFIPESPQQIERKQLILQYNVLLFSILFLYLLRVVSVLPVLRLLSVIGFNVTVNSMTGMVLLSPIANQVCGNLCYIIYMSFPAAMILFFAKGSFSLKKMFSLPYARTIRYGVPILLGASLVAELISQAFNGVMKSGGIVLLQAEFQPPSSLIAFILYLLLMTVLPAFFEEFLFRGVILRSMRRFGDMIAILVSTILFTLIQPSASGMVSSFLIGLISAYFALRSGSIWVPILANFLTRCVHLLNWVFLSNYPQKQSTMIIWFLIAALLGLSIFVFCRFILKDKRAFQICMDDTNLTNRTKIKYLFTNFGFWMVVILAVSNIIKNLELIN